MTRVYLSDQGSIGTRNGGRLQVERDGQVVTRVPLATIDQVIVVGQGVQLTTALLVDLMRRGVDVAFMSRTGRFYGRAGGGPTGGADLRAAQHSHLSDPRRAARFAGQLVAEKLAGQAAHLAARGLTSSARQLGLPGEAAVASESVDRVRGFEGAGAALYWRSLAGILPPAWGFHGRRHHPPPDPLNAALSFGYTLLLNELTAQVTLIGLDLQRGALHPPDAGRPSLALDLIEPFRPLGIDRWVFDAALKGTLRPEHFVQEEGRTLLGPVGRRAFLELYERAMGRRVRHPLARGRVTVRQAVELHGRLAAQLFRGERAALEPVGWP